MRSATPEPAEAFSLEWGAAAAVLQNEESRLTRALAAWWENVLRTLTVKAVPDAVIAHLHDLEWWRVQDDALTALLAVELHAAAQAGTARAGQQLRITGLWDYVNPRAAAWAQAHAGELVTSITPELRETVNQVLAQAVNTGESWPTIREQLTGAFPKWRAERIARTEVIRAGTQGAYAGYVASGTVRGLRWMAGQAGACPVCAALNNQVRALGEPFYQDTFGDGLPPRHPHCRCAVAPVTVDQARRLPANHPLRENRRNNVAELTDRDTYTEIGGVRITGERRRHWQYRHQGHVDMARAEALLPQLLTQPDAIKQRRGTVYVLGWSPKTYLIAPVDAQGRLRSLYLRNRREVDKW